MKKIFIVPLTLSILLGVTTALVNRSSVSASFLEAQYLYGILTTVAIAIGSFLFIKMGIKGLFTPHVFVVLGLLLFLFLPPLINPSSSYIAYSIYSNPSKYLPLFGYLFLALLSFILGSLTPKRAGFSKQLSFKLNRSKFSMVYIFTVIFWCLILILILATNGISMQTYFFQSRYSGVFGADIWNNPLGQLTDQVFRFIAISLGPLSVVVIKLSKQRSLRILAIFYLIFISIYYFMSGTRYRFVYSTGTSLLVLFGLYFQGHGFQLNLRKVVIFTIPLLVVIFVVFQMANFRNSSRDGIRSLSQIRVSGITDFIGTGIDQNVFLSYLFEIVPDYRSYIWGLSFLSTFVLFVPRSLWLTKPSTAWFYLEEFVGVFSTPNASYSIVGELYLNFGIIGICVGMFLLGLFSTWWYRFFSANNKSLPVLVLYYMSLPAFTFVVRGDFQTAVGGILYPMLVVATVFFVSKNRFGGSLVNPGRAPGGL